MKAFFVLVQKGEYLNLEFLKQLLLNFQNFS